MLQGIKYCSQCGNRMHWIIPENDTRKRYVCLQCSFIDYQNPKLVAGCIVYKNDSVLLCKRAINPRLGMWTLPAGFMENGETTKHAAERETLEETGAQITATQLFAITNSPHVNHVNIFYLAQLDSSSFHPTNESSEVKLFKKGDISELNLAFHTVEIVLSRFFQDLERGFFSTHEIDF